MAGMSVSDKIKAGELFNCKDISKFVASVVQVLPFKGVSMSRFYVCEFGGVRFLTKMCFYRKSGPELYGEPNNKLQTHIDAEIKILAWLKREIINKGVTPCILEMVHSQVCDPIGDLFPMGNCEQIMRRSSSDVKDDAFLLLCKYNDMVKNGLAYDKCAWIVLERCDVSMEEYLKRSVSSPVAVAVFKSLLFMVIHAIWAINRKYPEFRHHDLHTENVMLKFDTTYTFKAAAPKYLVFHVDDAVYTVPYFGIIPKIIDFGYSAAPEVGIVSNATLDKVLMFHRSDNDLLFFFFHVYHTLDYAGADAYKAIGKMLNKLDPTGSFIQYNTEHIRSVAKLIPTYTEMVTNKVFDEYLKLRAEPSEVYNEF